MLQLLRSRELTLISQGRMCLKPLRRDRGSKSRAVWRSLLGLLTVSLQFSVGDSVVFADRLRKVLARPSQTSPLFSMPMFRSSSRVVPQIGFVDIWARRPSRYTPHGFSIIPSYGRSWRATIFTVYKRVRTGRSRILEWCQSMMAGTLGDFRVSPPSQVTTVTY